MKSIRPASSVLITAALVVAACGGSDDTDDSAPIADDVATTVSSSTTAASPTSTTADPPATSEPAPEPTAVATSAPPTTRPSTTAPPTTVPAPEWSAIGPGEFSVGVTTVTVDDPTRDRPMTVDVWFPLADDVEAATLAPHRYTLLPGIYYESPDAVTAEPSQLRGGEAYPLVVYSHGSGGIRYLHSSYTEALASHGYLVVAPDHTGNTLAERFAGVRPGPEVVLNRPNDVRLVIDAFVDPSHPVAGPFAASVDAEQVAVTGHSFGGYTAIALVTGVTTELGEVVPDERVDAIIPMAPASGDSLLPDERIAAIDVPMMVLVGTDDASTPVDPNVTRLWDIADNTPAYRVELVAGVHQTFTELCAYRDFLPMLDDIPEIIVTTIDDFSEESCSPSAMAPDRAADLTNTYVVQFLDQVFRDGPAIDAAATPDDVIFDAR